jgi:site-specific DNA-methyltransferase (adenine-specific)
MSISRLIVGDCLAVLPTMDAASVQTCITSPPYFGLRDYGGGESEIGREETVDSYVQAMVSVFREVRRVLRDDGTLWLNLGDSYARQAGDDSKRDFKSVHTGQRSAYEANAMQGGNNRPPNGFKPKDLIGIPWRIAFALQADGWYLRQDIIWNKPNPMPESVKDRCTKAHEYIFLLSKNPKYYFDNVAIKEDAKYSDHHSKYRTKRSVWTVALKPFRGAHFATFPTSLIEPCVLAGCPVGGVVLDPFNGAGTTGLVAMKHARRYIGIELNEKYADITMTRLGLFSESIKLERIAR